MIASIAVVLFSAALATTPCASLKSVSLPNTTITMAEPVPAGTFTPPGANAGGGRGGQRGGQNAGLTVPAFCRVAATLKPSSDSEIDMEVWLPENWNGKFEFVGGGGWAGVISYPAMAQALEEGYATASTDTGHKGGTANFAIGHPEKLVDFAYRAVHESTVKSKAIMMTFYDRAPKYSYWNGCSTGGRQGLMEAQRYPDDFDAIVAGAPANYQTHLHTWDLSVSVPVLKDPAAVVSPAKAAMLNKAVLNACDAKDGVKDGLLNDPRSCKFDPATLLCKAGDSDSCLTAPQLEAVKRMYSPAKTKSGQIVFPGKEPGSETGWNAIAGGQAPQGVSLGSFLVAYDDANWDWKSFDLDRDLKMVDEKVGNIVNAVNPDLSAFKARGGKLILYHGWNDTAISPGNTINYYNSVLSKMGPKQDNWIRLFMIPGMGHCQGGPGPSQVNYMGALERWRESGVAPEQMQAFHVTNNRVDMARP
ncbi:MAG TPA: tannase/feruloyl esterase family alpha/beta hydrolase, partial [Terriglobia bacterium]|nr:tannase/feruloyl esterase family alpha/beta hydrolase [Terriglobia bacterium]